jgi:hypoxanthine phosphoribosyltransferase
MRYGLTKITKTIGTEEIATRIAALGREIRDDAGDAPLFLLGILKGASVFLSDLMRAIPGEIAYGFIDTIRDEADTHTATALEIDFLRHIDIAGRNVYVLKDVVSTGIIENYLLAQLRLHKPATLKLVALLDRPSMRTLDLAADFRAFEVGEGSYAGYGLELEERWGNLPWIGTI